MRRTWPIIATCSVAIIAIATGLYTCDGQPGPAPVVDASHPPPEPDLGRDVEPQEPAELWLVAEAADGEFAALLNGEPTQAEFVVGAAGVYPPLETTGTHIALPTPARTMSGESLDTVEVYARTDDGLHVFWGEVSVEATSVDLRDAQTSAIRVVGEDGSPRPNATVRIALDAVGLVLLEQTTDADGRATFEALPPGEYVAMAEVAGAPVSPGVLAAGAEVTLYATLTRDVFGTVTDPDGAPIAGAVVAVHGSGIDSNPIDDIPADIVKTDATGKYRATGVPGAQFVAVAVAEGFPPGLATTIASEGATQLDVALRGGNVVIATVTNAGRPVEGAKVEWRDTATSAGATRLSDALGRVRFVGVPVSAELFANFNHFESGRVELASLTPSPQYEVALNLESTDGRIWRYRVETPQDVVMSDLEIYDGSGVRCSVSTNDGRDFVARSCGDGEVRFEARTNFGIAHFSEAKFVDGKDVALPAPTPVEVRVAGANQEPWAATMYTFAGATTGLDAHITELAGNGQRVTTRAYPGTWKMVVSNPRIGTMPFTLRVGEEPFYTEIELVSLHRFSLIVVDRFGAALTGAYAMLFGDDGQLLDVSRSAGQLPIEFRVRPPFNGELLVVDPRRGEGAVRLETSGEPPERVELDKRVLSAPVPTSRPTKTAFEQRTGAALVERDAGWVLDFSEETAGTRAGLQRGDLLVTAWVQARNMRVIVKRGPSYVDVSVPVR